MDITFNLKKRKMKLIKQGKDAILIIPTKDDGRILKTCYREWEAELAGILNDKATTVEDAAEFVNDDGDQLWRRVVFSELLTGADFVDEGITLFEVFFQMRFEAYYYKPEFHGPGRKDEIVWHDGAPLDIMIDNFDVRTCDGSFNMDFKEGDGRLTVKNEHGIELSKDDVFYLIKKNTDFFNVKKYDNLVLFLLDN